MVIVVVLYQSVLALGEVLSYEQAGDTHNLAGIIHTFERKSLIRGFLVIEATVHTLALFITVLGHHGTHESHDDSPCSRFWVLSLVGHALGVMAWEWI